MNADKELSFALKLSAFCLIVCVCGCAYFVPGTVKREVSLTRVDVETCVEEVATLNGQATALMLAANDAFTKCQTAEDYKAAAIKFKDAAAKATEARDKAMRTFNRLYPHIQNVDNYMQMKKADQSTKLAIPKESEIK